MRFLLLFLLLTSSAPALAQTTDAHERGRLLTRWLLAGELDSLHAVFAPEFSQAIGGRAGLGQLHQQVQAQAGAEVDVWEEAVYREMDHVSYYRRSGFEKLPDVTTRWVWDETGRVVGAQLTPTPQPAPTEHLDYDTKTLLRLPFDGTWQVAWGGRTPHQNYHVVAPDQRFAYDFVAVQEGALFTGDGTRSEDYFCFGQPVYAPASGTVVTAVDSVADNVPVGTMNRAVPPGNYVVLDHGNGEFSLLAHFQHGSVAVAVGDAVQAGDVLGACGNSGNSSLPHLHYHLQTGLAYGNGVGLPAFFNGYTADDQPVERGEPVRGQVIRHDSF